MELSERQQKTIAAAITVLAGLVILATVLGLLWILARFLHALSLVFLPLAVAGIGALVLQPYYDWLRTQLRLSIPLDIAVSNSALVGDVEDAVKSRRFLGK